MNSTATIQHINNDAFYTTTTVKGGYKGFSNKEKQHCLISNTGERISLFPIGELISSKRFL